MGTVIAVSNQKGGVGKSTSAINLACAFAAAGKKVLVIDTDPQGNTTSGLGVEKKDGLRTVYELLSGENAETCVTHVAGEGLDVVPAGIDLAGVEVELATLKGRESYLRKAIVPLREAYDYLFIDCPPSLGLLTINALTAADEVVIPIQCEFFALEGMTQLLNTVRLVRKHLNPSLSVGAVLMTMYDPRTNLATAVAGELKKYFGSKVLTNPIPRTVRLAEAPSHGMSIFRYAPRSTGAAAYSAAAAELLEKVSRETGGKTE